MLKVFVLDKNKKQVMPCHPARARKLISLAKARVYRHQPFTIILTEREGGGTQPTELKVDPGSKVTGMALVGQFKNGRKVIFAANLEHRGHKIKESLDSRRSLRRSRRNRKTRYRQPRFDNRSRPKGWLPPSLKSRVDNVHSLATKFSRFAPISEIAVETVRFDTQKILNPEISGQEYQQGELFGYEIREYLLEKWGRKCAYCLKKDIPLEIEHIVPKSKGGSNRASNLTLACTKCNLAKGNKDLKEFVKDSKKRAKLLVAAKAPMRDAAAVNATRYATGSVLKSFDLPTSFWSGGRTKHNRIKQDYPKDHWLDAVCVGPTGENVFCPKGLIPLVIQAQGRGSRQQCRVDRYGFPRTTAKAKKRVHGFQTGDLVKAVVLKGKKKGTYVGRVAVRSSGNFNIKTRSETIQGINHRYCRLLQRQDGYSYSTGIKLEARKKDSDAPHRFSPKGLPIPPPPKGGGILEDIK